MIGTDGEYFLQNTLSKCNVIEAGVQPTAWSQVRCPVKSFTCNSNVGFLRFATVFASRSIGQFGLRTVIHRVLATVSHVALSSRSRLKIRYFGSEWLLTTKADASENSVYFRSADRDTVHFCASDSCFRPRAPAKSSQSSKITKKESRK